MPYKNGKKTPYKGKSSGKPRKKKSPVERAAGYLGGLSGYAAGALMGRGESLKKRMRQQGL